MSEKIFVDGMIVKRNDKAPEYVLCNLSIKVAELVPFLEQHQSNGWVNVQCMVSKAGKHYAELDTWKPTQGDIGKEGMAQARAAAAEPMTEMGKANKHVRDKQAAATDFMDDSIPF